MTYYFSLGLHRNGQRWNLTNIILILYALFFKGSSWPDIGRQQIIMTALSDSKNDMAQRCMPVPTGCFE